MIVNKISNIEMTERDVKFKEGRSLRLLLASDGMGFSVHHTTIPAGEVGKWHYKRHLEACYCVSGSAEVEQVATGICHPISPGTIYALNEHDEHIFRAFTDVVLISIFNPPCVGREVHKEDGSYDIPEQKIKYTNDWDD